MEDLVGQDSFPRRSSFRATRKPSFDADGTKAAYALRRIQPHQQKANLCAATHWRQPERNMKSSQEQNRIAFASRRRAFAASSLAIPVASVSAGVAQVGVPRPLPG
jgi:hypothetical protein